MIFFNPWGFLLLSGLPIVYFLSYRRKKVGRKTVPTLMLWFEDNKESINYNEKKRQSSLRLLLHALLVFFCVLGLLDMHKVVSVKTPVCTLVYDKSLSMGRVKDFTPLYRFFKADEKNVYKIIFIDEKEKAVERVLKAYESKKRIEREPLSKLALDKNLVKAVVKREEQKGNDVVFVSDKVIEGIKNQVILPVDTRNVGLRQVMVNPLLKSVEVALENDDSKPRVAVVQLSLFGETLTEKSVYLAERATKSLIFTEKIVQDAFEKGTGILIVEIREHDSLYMDNQYIYPFVPQIELSIENSVQSKALNKVFSLLPYANIHNENGYPLDIKSPVYSNVKYSPLFLKAVEEGRLFESEITNMPYFPLWIEDHVQQAYKQIVNRKFLDMVEKPPAGAYLVDGNKQPVPFEEKSSNRHIPGFILMFFFMAVLIGEEEVYKRV